MKQKSTLFKEKAQKYTVCFADNCPLHDHCLRWEVGLYVDTEEEVLTCINPRHKKVEKGQCPNFRDNQPLKMPLGMTKHFYYDMPQHQARNIKQALIDHYGRTIYYRYHSAHRPISPDVLQFIQSVCLEYGWTQPLQCDSEIEDYLW